MIADLSLPGWNFGNDWNEFLMVDRFNKLKNSFVRHVLEDIKENPTFQKYNQKRIIDTVVGLRMGFTSSATYGPLILHAVLKFDRSQCATDSGVRVFLG